jgi:hypothetical protein
VASVLITRAFSIGMGREETHGILPPVGARLWNRPEVPVGSSGAPSSPEGDGG